MKPGKALTELMEGYNDQGNICEGVLIATSFRRFNLAARQDGVAVAGVQVGSKGRPHEAGWIGIRLHPKACLSWHRKCERPCTAVLP